MKGNSIDIAMFIPLSIFFTNETIYIFSLELRDLRAKLRAGYMNKERSAQLAEKKAIEVQKKVKLP